MSFGLKRSLGLKKGQYGENYLQQSLAGYQNLQMPTYDQMAINGASVDSLDPTARNAQLAALQQMQGIATQGGMTAIDKARLQQIQEQTATQARGAREAIMQNAQARGMGGSGAELANLMQGQQSASDQAGRQAVDVNSAAQQRALQAMAQTGQLGGQISQQDLQRAQAQDEIRKFNSGIRQTQFENDLQRLNGMSGVYGDLANAEQQRQQRKLGVFGSLLNLGGQAMNAFGPKGGAKSGGQ